MFHIALTPATSPTNAISAKAPTTLGAIANLLNSLDKANADVDVDWIVPRVLEATKEAIDNLENYQPAKGIWTDMGCEDDSFSIDIFCADDAKYVRFDGDYLLAPHGAVALAIGEHNHQEWIYDESDVSQWDNVLRPIWCDAEHGLDEAVRAVVDPTITGIIRTVKHGLCTLSAMFSDDTTCQLFSFYTDELSFADEELIGKTASEAHQLHSQRDAQYLRS